MNAHTEHLKMHCVSRSQRQTSCFCVESPHKAASRCGTHCLHSRGKVPRRYTHHSIPDGPRQTLKKQLRYTSSLGPSRLHTLPTTNAGTVLSPLWCKSTWHAMLATSEVSTTASHTTVRSQPMNLNSHSMGSRTLRQAATKSRHGFSNTRE